MIPLNFIKTAATVMALAIVLGVGSLHGYAEPEIVAEEPEVSLLGIETEPAKAEKEPYRYAGLIHLTTEERHTVESVVCGEAGNQPYEGKLLVAQAFYNAMLRNNASPSKVRKDYSYGGYKNIDTYERECKRCGSNNAQEIKDAVKQVFDDYDMPTDDFVLWFYNPKACRSSFHESMKPINGGENYIGNHKFFALWEEPTINYTRELKG